MTLSEYVAATKTPVATIAAELRVAEPTVYRWMSRKRMPSAATMKSIHKMTLGVVSPNDWVLAPEVAA